MTVCQPLDASWPGEFRPSCRGLEGAKRMASPFYTAEHEAYREVVRRFVEKEIAPFAHEWDEAGGFPRGLYEKAAAIGLLGLGFPGEYGGTGVDNLLWVLPGPELAPARPRRAPAPPETQSNR